MSTVDCINMEQCETSAVVMLDITETSTASGNLEFPTQHAVPYCAECAGDLTRILIENGSLLNIRVGARLV